MFIRSFPIQIWDAYNWCEVLTSVEMMDLVLNQYFTEQVSNMATRRQQRWKCCSASQSNQSLGEVTSFSTIWVL